MKNSQPKQIRKWLTIIEFIIVNLATWLNPEAGLLLLLLKLCFLILRNLQDDNKDDRKQ